MAPRLWKMLVALTLSGTTFAAEKHGASPRPRRRLASDGGDCPAGETELRMDIYNGRVRDADPNFFYGESDAYCVMKVRGEEQSTRVSSTFLDNNNPPFMEFYHFGCQPHDAAIDFQCFDWDRRQDHEVVFTGETLRAWPASNEQFRWDDRDEPKYHFNVVLAYDGDGDSATSSSSSKSTREGDLTIGIVGLVVVFLLGLACGGCLLYKKRGPKGLPTTAAAEVVGMEMAEVVVIDRDAQRSAAKLATAPPASASFASAQSEAADVDHAIALVAEAEQREAQPQSPTVV